ncbi:MAG: response regulator transcription factor [Pseudomonadota bacterium]
MPAPRLKRLHQKITSVGLGRIAFFGVALALAAFVLTWIQYRHAARLFPSELYISIVAVGFALLGLWAGRQLTPAPKPNVFEQNTAAMTSLGISPREYDILSALADGLSNKEIARRFDISPNTVKTHMARLFEKLDVSRRTQAVRRARELSLLP